MNPPRAYGPGEVDALPPSTRPVFRRVWWRDPLTFWRPFEHARQLRPCVWVADDLSVLVLSARESMGLRDPFEQRDADGVMRRYRRCTSDIWMLLRRTAAPGPAFDRLRATLAEVHSLEGVRQTAQRVNAEAAA